MGYLSVDIDIDDIVNAMSSSDKRVLAKELSDRELLQEVKRRELKPSKVLTNNSFTLESNITKREVLIKMLDLPSFANDDLIIKAVKEHI